MYDINHLPNVIGIGFTGEMYFRRLEIDMSSWIEEMPSGAGAIAYVKPGSATCSYPTVTMPDGILTWEISDTDVGSTEGHGEIQIEMSDTIGGVQRVRKSKIIRVDVNKGLSR